MLFFDSVSGCSATVDVNKVNILHPFFKHWQCCIIEEILINVKCICGSAGFVLQNQTVKLVWERMLSIMPLWTVRIMILVWKLWLCDMTAFWCLPALIPDSTHSAGFIHIYTVTCSALLTHWPKVLPWDERKGCDVQSPQWREYFVTINRNLAATVCMNKPSLWLDETKTEQEVYLKE